MLRPLAAAGSALALIVAVGTPAFADSAPRPRTLAVSVTPQREEAGADRKVVMSADARYVVFVSSAADLPGAKALRPGQIYRRDLHTGTTRLVSLGRDGQPADSPASTEQLAVSGSGRYVAFVSRADNLVAGEPNRLRLLVRDMTTRTISVVNAQLGTAAIDEAPIGNELAMSADGQYLLWSTSGPGVLGYQDGRMKVYRFDIQANVNQEVSRAASGRVGSGDSGLRGLAISADGRFVAYDSTSSDLLPGVVVTGVHTYVRDVVQNTTQLVDRSPTGAVSVGTQGEVAISGDGRYVAFEAQSDVMNSNNWDPDLYRRDLRTGLTERVSVPGPELPRYGIRPALSTNGRYVAFTAIPFLSDTPIGPDPFFYPAQAYVRDMSSQSVQLVDALPSGRPVGAWDGTKGVYNVALSGDGRFAAYATADPGVLPGRPESSSRVERAAAYVVGPLR